MGMTQGSDAGSIASFVPCLQSFFIAALPGLKLELMPEVDLADFLVIQDSLGITLCNYLTFADDVCLLADVECFPDIVVGQKYAYVP